MALDPNTGISVAVGVASAQSGVLQAGAWWVSSTTACWIATGTNPTAVAGGAGSTFVPANFPTPVTIMRSDWKLAVIRVAVDGWISIAQGGD